MLLRSHMGPLLDGEDCQRYREVLLFQQSHEPGRGHGPLFLEPRTLFVADYTLEAVAVLTMMKP
jgi:hypothetical protein